MVRATARFFPALQISEHHDRGCGRIFQSIHENRSYTDLRPVFAAHGHSDAGTEIQRERRRSEVSLESRRSGLCNAGARGSGRQMADHSADHELAGNEVWVAEGRL